MFAGYASRIEKEIKALYVEKGLKNTQNKTIKITINIIDSPRRKHSVFIGATILANFYNKKDIGYWITKEEYEESGEQIILRKCPNMTN
jgi:actin-related protein 2